MMSESLSYLLYLPVIIIALIIHIRGSTLQKVSEKRIDEKHTSVPAWRKT